MNLFKNVHESWIPLLHSLAYKEPLVDFLSSLSQISYQPDVDKIFKVFEMPVKDIKVVILGQEPYPRPGNAIGYAFAAKENSQTPNILEIIKRELIDAETPRVTLQGKVPISESIKPYQQDIKMKKPGWQTLNHWVDQGVFLLNSALTVETGNAGSHLKYWREFTDTVISFISSENPCIWMLWGSNALSYSIKIKNPLVVRGYDRETIEEIPVDPTLNYIMPGEHPAIINMGYETFSNNGFYYTNRILEKRSLKKIIW